MKNVLCLFSLTLLCGMICFSCNPGENNNRAEDELPNILLIMADDMGYSDLSCFGGEISTPNIDQLATEGLRFSQFYNAARCCPTRSSLLTGLYPHQAGMGGMVVTDGVRPDGAYQGYLSRNSITIAEVLKQQGYYTAASGKWHVGEKPENWPLERGFDNYYGLISGAANFFDITRAKWEGVKRYFAVDSTEYIPDSEDFYMTTALTENAIKFLKIADSKEQPFFLYLPYTAPHWPLHALQEDIDLYRGKYAEGWDVLREKRYKRMVEMGLIDKSWPLSDRDPRVPSWESLSEEQKEKSELLMSIYAAQIHRMDQGIGEVMEQLEVMGESENTIVFFLSDNGASEEYEILGKDFWGNFWDGDAVPGSGDSYHSYGAAWANLSNTPFRQYKKQIHEGGISTPLIVKWPGHIKDEGSITHKANHIIDIMATICDITGAAYPESYNGNTIIPLAGRSFAPLLKGESLADHKALYWEHQGNRAIREGNWKLVSLKGKDWELYNLSTDRSEMNDLISGEQERAERMKVMYKEWADELGVR